MMEKGRSYLKIVEDVQNYEEIVDTKIFFEKLFDRIMESNCSKTSDIEKLLNYEKIQLNGEKMKILQRILEDNLDIIKQRTVEKFLAMSHYYLVDFNWNLNVAISSIKLAKIQVPLLSVEFILKKYEEENEFRVLLELSKEELKGFLENLHQMELQIEI